MSETPIAECEECGCKIYAEEGGKHIKGNDEDAGNFDMWFCSECNQAYEELAVDIQKSVRT